MDDTTFITLSGHAKAISLTASAHERLLQYLDDARSALGADPDADETIRDLETSLGDRLHSFAARPGQLIEDAEMKSILVAAGPVVSANPADRTRLGPARGAFWCRIEQGKWFGGLCLGIATRGDFRVDWVRTVAILLALLTAGLIGVAYLALLLFLPRVETVAEYRRLREAPRPA